MPARNFPEELRRLLQVLDAEERRRVLEKKLVGWQRQALQAWMLEQKKASEKANGGHAIGAQGSRPPNAVTTPVDRLDSACEISPCPSGLDQGTHGKKKPQSYLQQSGIASKILPGYNDVVYVAQIKVRHVLLVGRC
eukprot:2129041-Amphidinium_carterae.1